MSVKGPQANGHSPKRRKLSHTPDESNSDAANHSGDFDASEQSHANHVASTKQLAKRGLKGTPHASAIKPTVLPTGGLNKAAVLALQIADLNADITPDYERLRPRWTEISNSLVSIIRSSPERSPAAATDALKSFRKQGIQIPFPQPPPSKDTNYKFEFKTPRQVLVGGPLPWGLSLKEENVIDIVAVMPEDLLQEKDYLNNRAFHKAAFYLSCLAAAIREHEEATFHMCFAYLHDVDLLPLIELIPKDKTTSQFKFRVVVGFPDAFIPIDKTLPTKNCLRQGTSGNAAQTAQPTPFYNSSIRHAASTSAFYHLTQSAKSPAFDEACHIGQLWLRQRGFSSSIYSGGFGLTEWTLICALLLRGGGHRGQPLFSKQYNALQFFKAVLQILAGRDLRDPMLLNGANMSVPRSDLPMLFDGSTGVNILYKMTPWSYQSLRHHAQVSLAAVNSRNRDSFDPTFILKVATPALQYDEVYSIRISAESLKSAMEERHFLHKLYSTLVRGLGDRVSLVDFRLPQHSSWSFDQKQTATKRTYDLEIALLVNPETITRLVDHGPSADEQEEAAEFRKFWGEKAELRRFKDGSISESLVWAPGSPVSLQIITHLAMAHFRLPPSSVQAKLRDLEPSVLGEDSSLSAKDAFRIINSTYQTLTSTLHNLEGLPLPIRSISPADPALRSSSTSHPLVPSTTLPIDVIIQFDSSTRWPDSLPAVQYTKIAFLLKIADLLTESDSNLTTRVGLENTDSATTGHFNTSFLDIIYPSPSPGLSPICFRARIHHDREAHLLQTLLADKSLHGSVRDSLTIALATYKRNFLAAPIHTTAIRNLCTRFPPLSATIRLLKKWVSAHLLLEHVPEELLEIIAANVFLRSAPWSTPGSATTALLRALHLLSTWDWSFMSLMVDLSLSQDMTAAQISEMQTRFEAWRKLDPNMNNIAWFVGTNLDGTGTVWTQGARPPRVVAGRLTALASAAIEVVENKGTEMQDEDWTGLFRSPLEDFDFRIYLKPSVLRWYKSRSKAKSSQINSQGLEFKNLQIHKALDVESIGYDPVALYLRDLNDAFGSTALFFHDKYGGSVIVGLWKPTVLGKKEWRVRLGWSSVPVPGEKGDEDEEGDQEKENKKKDMCVLNKDAILKEMALLGEGIVREITVKESIN